MFVNGILYYKNIVISFRIGIQVKLRYACCEAYQANHVKVILCKAGEQDLKETAFALGQVFSLVQSLSLSSLCTSCLDQDCITQIVIDDIILGTSVFFKINSECESICSSKQQQYDQGIVDKYIGPVAQVCH